MDGGGMREVVLSSRRRPALLAAAIGLLAVLVVVIVSSPGTNLVNLFWVGVAVAAIYRLVAAPPTLWVDDLGMTLAAPAVLRQPLHIDRQRVHSVYLFPDAGRSFLWRQWFGNATTQKTAPEPTCWWAPDMGAGVDRPQLLIVLDPSLSMRDAVKRRTGALLLFGLLAYRGPTRFTFARGLLFPVADPDQAARAFEGWLMPGALDPALRTWVDGDRIQGRWGWKKAKTAT